MSMGGDMKVRSWSACVVLVLLAVLLVVPAARADFGLVSGGFGVTLSNSDGTVDQSAGSHPYALTVKFAANTAPDGHTEGGEVRDAVVGLPPGIYGNPHAMPACSRADFEGGVPRCPPSTQVGELHADLPALGEISGPVYNIAPVSGSAAELGFSSVGFTSLQYVSLRTEQTPSGERYGLMVTAPDLPLEVSFVEETIWGTPADPSHDAQRVCFTGPGKAIEGCSTDTPPVPYLVSPTSCQASPLFTVGIDSTLNPGVFVTESTTLQDAVGAPAVLGGCEAVPFSPSIEAASTSGRSDSASGLSFQVRLPDQGLLKPDGIVETQPQKIEVAFPQGMAINPAAANGTSVCTLAQYQAVTAEHEGCPESARIGTFAASTPLLEEQLEGSVYLAAPHDNPFGSLLAVYLVGRIPRRGLLIKQAGLVHADPSTGQLTATFDDLPPVAYSSFTVKLREGPRAPLVTPQACGTYTTTVRLYPFSNPTTPVTRTSDFTVGSGANGGACASGESGLPNAPSLEAGMVTALAGGFSPLIFSVSREDGTQRFHTIDATLPEGLLGKLAGVPYCTDAQIAAAAARGHEGEGALEQSSPSCPESSQVGVVNIAAGAGSQPYHVQGKAYLAGPYEGAPVSLAVITPAIAGPFDLGVVVVRIALHVDRSTAQITATSDPIPSILDGIPLDVRSVSLQMNRSGFTFNPTSCEPTAVTGLETSLAGQIASLSNRFQVGGCQGLPFKPAMAISTQGKTSKANGASLTVKLSQKPGEANIHKVDLTLPTVLPARLTTLQQACTEAQFAINPAGCPPGSFIGTAKAITPVLSVPLTGPAILVSHGGAAFPDVVFLLQANERGGDIRIDLDGRTDIKKGITYSRFETVPDAPITSFETSLPEGPHSVLAATGNLCASKLSIPTELIGQNGAQINQNTPVTVAGCPKTKVLSRAQKLALALKACKKKAKGKKRTSCERVARKKYGPAKKAKRRG